MENNRFEGEKGKDRGMKDTNEQEFIREYNQVYGKVVSLERKKRGLTLEQLSSGIMSRTALEKVEKGAAQWTKVEGDTLMLRMGIPPEYFESLASGEDLERWRLREDICLLVPDRSEEAARTINRYRLQYKKRGVSGRTISAESGGCPDAGTAKGICWGDFIDHPGHCPAGGELYSQG